MTEQLAALVAVESPSADLAATARCADLVAGLGREMLGAGPEVLSIGGRTHLRWRWPGQHRVLLLGHLDTVWPIGTLARLPFEVTGGDRATGPGCFDMKAGLVQMFHALAELTDLAGVTVLVTSDEEIGSDTSRGLIEAEAQQARAVLVLEPSAEGALKTARKGTSFYRVRAQGRAAHAGLDPERGVNAALELAHQVLAVTALQRAAAGTVVTPTLLSGGTTENTVPASASMSVDVRCATVSEQERVDREIRALPGVLPGSSLTVAGEINRPPMPAENSALLFAVACQVAAGLGLPEPEAAAVGGASDGNLTAALGVPTLDGLGAVGGGAHADDEHVLLSAMPERAALLAGIVEVLVTG